MIDSTKQLTNFFFLYLGDHLISEYTRGRNIPRLLPGVDCQSQNALKLLKTVSLEKSAIKQIILLNIGLIK